jgi:hypothetical protein
LIATSPGQHLSVRFDRVGVKLDSGVLTVGVGLRGIGYGSSLRTVGPVAPSARANRVSYAHAAVNEWYANGPLGLEQGFAITHAPSGPAVGPLTLAMALSGNAHASVSARGQSVLLSHGATSLRYGGLMVTDARGRTLTSRLELHGDTVLLRVDARRARYPLRIDPLIQQGGKLTPSDEQGGSEAGTSVAISADGNTALIGGIGDEQGGKPMAGAAWVFTRSGSTWTQQGPKLVGSDEEGEAQFGISVALSADGNTALIGGINDETGGKQVGAAWVFTRSGSTWTQQGGKLTGAGETPGGRFGKSVALSSDGDTALIGGYFDNNSAGAAWVFTRLGSTWSQQGAKLTGAGEAGEAQFGLSVALSAAGDTALVGGPSDEGAAKVAMSGAAWVFTRSGSAWTEQGPKLTGTGEEGAGELGTSVALSADGYTALTGGPGDGESGAAWAFHRSGATWEQQGSKLAPSDATKAAGFGLGVALSDDGDTALIGGPVDKDSAVPTGAAWQFARAGSSWSQQGPKLLGGGEAPESEFGAAVALSADGDTALLGGPIDHGNTGAAWAFVNAPSVPTTGAVADLTPTSATLNGTVAAGASSRAFFQYGTSTAYGVTTPGQAFSAAVTTGPVTDALSGLLSDTTYHFRLVVQNSGGISVGADQAFTTPSLVPPACACVLNVRPLAPVITSASQSHRRWIEGGKPARVSAKKKSKLPVGTTFSFTLSKPASVSLAFTQRVNGRKVAGKCVAQTKGKRSKHTCPRTLTRGTLVLAAREGPNKVSFQGAISRSEKLEPGRYTLLMTATSAGLRSSVKSLTFTIVK